MRMSWNVPYGNIGRQAKCSLDAIRASRFLRNNMCMDGKRYRRTYLREWRKHRDRTLVQVAEELHVTHGYLSKVERGLQPYNQELLERLAELYRCAPVDLLIRDPSEPMNIWSIWEQAKPGERRQIETVAEALVRGRTGTEG
jgi:transcriptional regulator with XRE-family HTH domain